MSQHELGLLDQQRLRNFQKFAPFWSATSQASGARSSHYRQGNDTGTSEPMDASLRPQIHYLENNQFLSFAQDFNIAPFLTTVSFIAIMSATSNSPRLLVKRPMISMPILQI